MASLQAWVVLVACGCFAAGGFGGWALASCGGGAAEGAPWRSFADDLTTRYELRPDQARSLAIVLQKEAADEDALLRSIMSEQLPGELRQRLLDLRRKTKQLIQYGVLDDKQRVLYDRDTDLPSAKPAAGTTTGTARPTDR